MIADGCWEVGAFACVGASGWLEVYVVWVAGGVGVDDAAGGGVFGLPRLLVSRFVFSLRLLQLLQLLRLLLLLLLLLLLCLLLLLSLWLLRYCSSAATALLLARVFFGSSG